MGAPAVLDKLTPEEREYYSHIATLSEKHRSLILKDAKNRRYVIPDISSAGTVAAAVPEITEIPNDEPLPEDTAGDLIVGAAATDIEAQSAADDDDFVVIRILEDLLPFASPDPDFNYDLKKEDVVRMPSTLASALINNEKAVPFKL